jgi:hypothetical protein
VILLALLLNQGVELPKWLKRTTRNESRAPA